MKKHKKPITILIVDDDADDRLLAEEALAENYRVDNLRFVENGEELMDYLHHRGKYTDRLMAPRPDLILLDLNMPKKNGQEALQEIKANAQLRQIPIVVLTTSMAEEDIFSTYDLGASSFITKPSDFDVLVDILKVLNKYWFQTVKLPPEIKKG